MTKEEETKITKLSLPGDKVGFTFTNYYGDRQQIPLQLLDTQVTAQLDALTNNPGSRAVSIAVIQGIPNMPFNLEMMRSEHLTAYRKAIKDQKLFLALVYLNMTESPFVRAFVSAAGALLRFPEGSREVSSEDEAQQIARQILVDSMDKYK